MTSERWRTGDDGTVVDVLRDVTTPNRGRARCSTASYRNNDDVVVGLACLSLTIGCLVLSTASANSNGRVFLFHNKLERPQSKTPVEAAAAPARRPRPPCSASRRAAPVHANFDHAHPSPASSSVSSASQPRALRSHISVTDSLTHRQPCEIHNSNRCRYKTRCRNVYKNVNTGGAHHVAIISRVNFVLKPLTERSGKLNEPMWLWEKN